MKKIFTLSRVKNAKSEQFRYEGTYMVNSVDCKGGKNGSKRNYLYRVNRLNFIISEHLNYVFVERKHYFWLRAVVIICLG